MDAKEWNSYVTKVATGAWPIPMAMIRDQNDWLCRSTVGRALYFKKEVEDAMAVLSTVLEVAPNMEDAPEQGMSECEHKVLCLRDLAEIVWNYTHNEEATLRYLDEAIKLCDEYKYAFRNGERGEIFYRRLNVLAESGKKEQAEQEAEAMIAAQKKQATAPQQEEPYAYVNPYIYFSYKFLAEQLYKEGHVAEACSRYEDALAYYPLNEAGKKDYQKAIDQTDPEARYKRFVMCSELMYVPWEKLPEVVIRH